MMDGNMARFGSAALLGFSVALALGASAFACGADNGEPPRCEGATCEDGRAPDGPDGSTPSEAGQETGTTDGGRDATDTGDAADTGTNCTGPAGTLDPTFGDGGIVVVPFAVVSATFVILISASRPCMGFSLFVKSWRRLSTEARAPEPYRTRPHANRLAPRATWDFMDL